jgi:hypothetical protein
MNGLAHPLQLFGRIGVATRARLRTPLASRLLSPPGILGCAVVAFLMISLWWVTQDDRIPDSATGNHVLVALSYHDSLKAGHVLAPFNDFNIYPPFVHLVGALSLFIGGIGISAPIMGQNLLFLPLLALGCYGAGSIAYDRKVGLLAALFALGTPMLISQFHVFMLDAPMASMAAVSAWLILASDRFEKVGYAGAAGVGVGIGMLTKNTFVLFVAGLILVAVVRGGWRNWRGLLAFAGLVAIIAAPWYLRHLSILRDYTNGAIDDPVNATLGPSRWSLKNFLWYGDNMFEHQLYLPLTIFFVIGAVYATRAWLRRRSAIGYEPELLVGGLAGYVGMTLLGLKDPRYTLPCLVYISVLATGWLVTREGKLRFVPTAALLAILVLNTASVDFGFAGSYRVALPGGWHQGGLAAEATLLGPPTFLEGRAEPQKDNVMELLRAAKADGAHEIYLAGGTDDWRAFNSNGLSIFARRAGLAFPEGNDPTKLGEKDFFLVRSSTPLPGGNACVRLRDHTGVYLGRSGINPHVVPVQQWHLFCPRGFGT